MRTYILAVLFLPGAVVACGDKFSASDATEVETGGQGGSSVAASGGAAGSSTGVAGSSTGAAGASSGNGGAGGGSSGGAGAGGSAGGGGSAGAGRAGGSPDAGSDASTICHDMSSVDSCGPTCRKCTTTSDRTVPTCNGNACGSSCRNGDPKCSDGTCSRLAWTFDAGSLDGIVVSESSGHPLAVRTFDGSMALAVDVDQLNTIPEVSFKLPICLSGTVDLSSKKLTFRVYFDGTVSDFFVQSAVPAPQTNAYLDQIGVTTGKWTPYSSPLNKSMFSATTTTITIQLGSLGGAFAGTIWLDDFKIQ